MRKRLVVFLILLPFCVAGAREHDTVEQLKARFETASNPKDRVQLALKVAETQVDQADKLYTAGKVDEARAAIQDIVSYIDKATDSATGSGKKLKDTEITVRKIAHKLADIKGTLNFEDQAPVQDAITHLEHVRTVLLSKMFNLGKNEK
jgi:hypothetical protein